MTAIKYSGNLSVIRSIQRELRKAIRSTQSQTQQDEKNTDPSVQHMLDLLKANQVTDKRFCRPPGFYQYLADTYLTYLRSSRLQDEITQKYFNKGEKSVEESARLVGLELPKRQEKH